MKIEGKVAKVVIPGTGLQIKSDILKLARCSGCEYLHENGNCLKVGGFYSAVNDENCPKKN